MSAKAISEATGKKLISKHLGNRTAAVPHKAVSVNQDTKIDKLMDKHPWLSAGKLVGKPDQLIKRRGKLGLLVVNKDIGEVGKWISDHMNKDQTIGTTTGKLKNFIIEPFVPHKEDEEAYVCIYSHRYADTILFYRQGGVNVGDIDSKALKLEVPVGNTLKEEDITATLLTDINPGKQEMLKKFIFHLYQCYVDLYFTYMEINPLVVTDNEIHMLDLAAKLDNTAEYICRSKWGNVYFPPPFGRDSYPEEDHIADLDSRTGASLKLTILNKKGRIWTMVAGGGASVIYSDTICDLGGTAELANYGEYSGDPNEQLTYEYAKTILSLMTREKHPDGKILLIGGGIANFTNVANTFKGIITALNEFKDLLVEHKIKIFVRRGGPNYQEGLKRMRKIGKQLGIPFYVFGPESHMTAICGMALGSRPIPSAESSVEATKANFLVTPGSGEEAPTLEQRLQQGTEDKEPDKDATATRRTTGKSGVARDYMIFTETTRAIVWGMQNRAVQSMLDFDFVCKRKEPSVAAVVYPFGRDQKQKFYWGHKEVLIPIYQKHQDAFAKHPEVDVLVSFASMRAAYQSTVDVMEYPQIRTTAIIAEGIPDNLTRKLIKLAKSKNIVIVGPATVGGVKPGCFKIGNTGGMMDNIIASKLHRPGSVAYVSKSGGMSNEVNNIVGNNTDGVYEGIAIGGDRYPGSTFMDHIKRYQADDNVKMIVLLGEVGGIDEYSVCDAIKKGEVTKPVVAWCIGTCATLFKTEVQFGHAGATAGSDRETATAKNSALKAAGAHVPDSFDGFGDIIHGVYETLVQKGVIVPAPDDPPPNVPMDYNWARQLGLIRKPANFITSITDERGQELIYAGMLISEVMKQNIGIGGVVSLLWFQRRLPEYVCTFFEICLMLTADHGPAVSGAHNTIVCARAGKDVISSLVSGLLTIGDRFGGALDGAAKVFSEAYDKGMKPEEFVDHMRSKGKLILGIGHRVKSINNPDKRVEILKNYVLEHFPECPLLKYSLEVEKVTTRKKANLILNVDGCIGVCFVDMLRSCGGFTKEEATEYLNMGAINSLFVLGRTIGFIGHFMDQKRLKQGLYRHPWDDITYLVPDLHVI